MPDKYNNNHKIQCVIKRGIGAIGWAIQIGRAVLGKKNDSEKVTWNLDHKERESDSHVNNFKMWATLYF